VLAAKIVMEKVERQRRAMPVDLLGKCIGQAREPAHILGFVRSDPANQYLS
jgi:hypothetical protein